MRLAAAIALVLLAARPAFALDCDLRQAKERKAFAEALVKVESTTEDAQFGQGDHCDEQHVGARVSRPLAGPLKAGDPVAFTLSQGACGSRFMEEHAFVQPGGEVVVLLARDAAGGFYQLRTESAEAHAAAQRVCSRAPGPR